MKKTALLFSFLLISGVALAAIVFSRSYTIVHKSREATVYAAVYNEAGSVTMVASRGGGYGEYLQVLGEYSHVVEAFNTALGAHGVRPKLIEQELGADFKIAFHNLPVVYGNDPPPLLPGSLLGENRHAAGSTALRKIDTPWLKGELYWSDNELVGGNLTVILSQLARTRELYWAYTDQWGRLATKKYTAIDDYSVKNEVLSRERCAYQKWLWEDYANRSARQLSRDDLKVILKDNSEDAIMYALLPILPPDVEFSGCGRGDNERWCYSLSERPLYEELYKALFEKAVIVPKDQSSISLLSPGEVRQIYERNYRYNCFEQ